MINIKYPRFMCNKIQISRDKILFRREPFFYGKRPNKI